MTPSLEFSCYDESNASHLARGSRKLFSLGYESMENASYFKEVELQIPKNGSIGISLMQFWNLGFLIPLFRATTSEL